MLAHDSRFKAIEKLKSRKLIRQIFEEGKSFASFPFRILYLFPGVNQVHLQAAFSVGTKVFKKAVHRNRVKRLMREAYRVQKSQLGTLLEEGNQHLIIFIIYTGKQLPIYQDIFQKMGNVLDELSQIVDQIARNYKNKSG